MEQKVARGQVTIVDLNDSVSVNLYLGANKPLQQIEDSAGNVTPDYSAENGALIITPELLASRQTSLVITGIRWKIKTEADSDYVLLTASNNGYATAADALANAGNKPYAYLTSAPYALYIYRNLDNSTKSYTVECEATYTDPTSQESVTAKTQLSIPRIYNPGQLEMAYIRGEFFFRYANGGADPEYIDLEAQLIRGNVYDETPGSTGGDTSTYSVQWYREVTGGSTEDTEDETGAIENVDGDGWQPIKQNGTIRVDGPVILDNRNANTGGVNGSVLRVYPDAVNGSARFRAVITDTDANSDGYNQTFIAEREILDYSDPFSVRIDASNGTVIKNGQGSTTLTAVLLSGGVAVTSGYTLTYAWEKRDANGEAVQDWTPATQGQKKTTPTLVVTAADIQSKATFVCNVSIK